MNLFIRVVDGKPFEHPIFEDNFRQAFPQVDTDNLPPEFARFTRVPVPALGVYEVYDGVTYEWDGAGYADVHHVRQMTQAERTAKQDQVKAAWAQRGFASWTFDESVCAFVPPTPYPQDGKSYKWSEPTVSWVLINE